MSVIVCRQQRALHPYYLEALGINVYTCQELCYAVYHHTLLFLDGFVDRNLIDFIRDELGMGFLAVRMEQRIKIGEKPEEIIFLFMQECDYYTTLELNRLRQIVVSLKKLSSLEYAKKKADYLVQLKQYGNAIAKYEEILEAAANKADDQFISTIFNNLGVCYARGFQFRKAMDAYEKAYGKKKDSGILENMYHLTKISSELEMKDKYRTAMSKEVVQQWDSDFDKAVENAKEVEEVKKLRELFEKEADQREEKMNHLVEEWKQEYRSMG